MDGFFKGFDETVQMLKGGWSLAKDTWNSAFGSAELKAVAMQRNRDRWQNMVQAFQSFVEMMRDPKLMELIEMFFPPEFLILLREPIGSPKFCETLGKLGFNALMDALIGLASGGALASIRTAIKEAMKAGGKLGGPAVEAAIEAAGKHVRKCTNCFVAGTLVVTACGWVPIEDVQVGDWVWARDEVTGEVRLCEVEETYRNESPVILEVSAGGETLATTPGHPFWVLDHGWKDAGELEVGDRLVNLRGESVVVEDIRRRPVPEAVYNFSVAGLHTYFVGQGGIWVHNNSGSGCGVPGAKRGPKTDPAAPHNATIRSEAQKLRDEGNTIVAGGGDKEVLVPTPGGLKNGRRPDILYETPAGEMRGRNVGRRNKNGAPVKRDVEALEDLNGPGGLPTDFVPYDTD